MSRALIAGTILLLSGCGLDDQSLKDRCLLDGDCNTGRLCVNGTCEDQGPLNSSCGTHDFNHDGHDDILWHDDVTGVTEVWYMNGASLLGSAELDPSLTLNDTDGWRLVGVGDFNQDGRPDIVAHNGISGVTDIWYMDGLNRIGLDELDPSLDVADASGSLLVAVCDFDQDGWPDLLWHDGATGDMQLWSMRGIARSSFSDLADATLALTDASGWQVIGTGDFNRDGKPDILWHNDLSGETKVWFMSIFTWLSEAVIDSSPNAPSASGWRLSETDDLNQDGWSDLVWWNPDGPTVELWWMGGTSRTGLTDIAGAPGTTEWAVVPH